MTALFIPLRACYYDAFAAGTKHEEYRLHGPRWNARTCRLGRPVILSRGYGKKHRLTGTITGFAVSTQPTQDFLACYPTTPNPEMAVITIALNS